MMASALNRREALAQRGVCSVNNSRPAWRRRDIGWRQLSRSAARTACAQMQSDGSLGQLAGFLHPMRHRITYRFRRLVAILSIQDSIRYFLMCLAKLPEFVRKRKLDLVLVDETVRRRVRVRYKGFEIVVDCLKIDRLLKEEHPTFSGVREMYVKDVYLKPFNLSRIEFRTVVDAGGNCGLFTIFAAKLAEQVIWVEAQESKYHPVLAVLREDNAPPGKIIEVGGLLVGSGDKATLESGVTAPDLCSRSVREIVGLVGRRPLFTMRDLIDRHVKDRISFLKMDVEGCEFSVMRDSEDWLQRVDNIAMEVHRDAGDPFEIVQTLERNAFRVVTVDAELRPVPTTQAAYIYGSITGALKC